MPGIPLVESTTRGDRTSADGTKPRAKMSDGASGMAERDPDRDHVDASSASSVLSTRRRSLPVSL